MHKIHLFKQKALVNKDKLTMLQTAENDGSFRDCQNQETGKWEWYQVQTQYRAAIRSHKFTE